VRAAVLRPTGRMSSVPSPPTKKKARKVPKRRSGGRWQSAPDRWASGDESLDAANRFLKEASRLILRFKPVEQCTEAEVLGWRLAIRLQTAFQGVPDDSYVAVLREALDAFDRKPSMEKERAWCVRAVSEWGEKWARPEWQASEKTRERCMEQLIRNLEVNDPAFAELRKDIPALAAKLDVWTPHRARGKKTSERILAEIIVEDHNALGLGPKDDEAEADAIERIRKLLGKEVDSFLNRSSSSKTA
jgi:hypothetical protein